MASRGSETAGVQLSDAVSQDKTCGTSDRTILRPSRAREPSIRGGVGSFSWHERGPQGLPSPMLLPSLLCLLLGGSAGCRGAGWPRELRTACVAAP